MYLGYLERKQDLVEVSTNMEEIQVSFSGNTSDGIFVEINLSAADAKWLRKVLKNAIKDTKDYEA